MEPHEEKQRTRKKKTKRQSQEPNRTSIGGQETSEQPTSEYCYLNPRQMNPTGEKKKTLRRKDKTMKRIPSESRSRTEQASETRNLGLAQGQATTAKKVEQSVYDNIPEPTAKKEKNKKPQESRSRDSGRRQRRQTKK